jgi:hypothetical protein
MFVTALILALFCSLSLSTQVSKNKWKVESLNFYRVAGNRTPNVAAYFLLYRTWYMPCQTSSLQPVLGIFSLGLQPCGWERSNYPISCYSYSIKDGDLQAPLHEWASCDYYPQGVEGERDVPEEAKQWLRWRVFDLEETAWPNRTAELEGTALSEEIVQPEGAEQTVGDVTPFRSMKIQIANGIPLNEYVSRRMFPVALLKIRLSQIRFERIKSFHQTGQNTQHYIFNYE